VDTLSVYSCSGGEGYICGFTLIDLWVCFGFVSYLRCAIWNVCPFLEKATGKHVFRVFEAVLIIPPLFIESMWFGVSYWNMLG
jgi:hypothetical protein